MSLLSSYAAATDPNFLHKITMAMIDGAINVINTSPNAERVEFARRVLRDSKFWAHHFAFAAASDDATTAASTDAQIRARLAVVFPAIVSAA